MSKTRKKNYKSSNRPTVWSYKLKRWEEKKNNKYLSTLGINNNSRQMTFYTNRKGFDKRAQRAGMKLVYSNYVDFVQNDTFGEKQPIYGKVMNLPREIIVGMSNKYQMTKRIIDSNNEHIIPKTFLDLEECIDNYKICNKNCRWYLKNIVGVDSNDVIRLANIDELINAWNLKLYPENYLAQQEIVSAKIKKEELPINSSIEKVNYDSKIVARVYLLLTKHGKWYFHKEIYLRCAEYETPVIGPEFNNARTDFYCRAIDWCHYSKILKPLKNMLKDVTMSFPHITEFAKKTKSEIDKHVVYCHIFGLDVGILPNYDVKLIEINVFPNFEGNSLPTGRVMDKCFDDLLQFIILPNIIGTKPKKNGWVSI